ncbi:MAG: energy transducer TonB [Rhodanobacter sp.]
MSSIRLAAAHRAHPEPARVAALSAAIALNLAVILIATRPVTPAYFPVLGQLAPMTLVRLITSPPVPAPPPPVELKPLPQVLTTPQVLPHPARITAPAALSSPQGRIAAQALTPPTAVPATAVATTPSASIEASLAYQAHPISYPIAALRQRLQGTVVLRVLVDETGKPLQASVTQGSGHALLDRSAREQVLAAWRFQPAIVNGHAVRAWATVPVTFALRS